MVTDYYRRQGQVGHGHEKEGITKFQLVVMWTDMTCYEISYQLCAALLCAN